MSKSDDEDFRRNRRRHQNREAARRCRQRRRDVSTNLLKEYQGLQSSNTQLIHEIRVLQKQKQDLDDCLGRLTTDSSSSSSSSCPSVAICRGLPKHLLSPADTVNRFGESSSTMTASSSSSGSGGSEVFSRTTNCELQEASKSDGRTAGFASNPFANGLIPCFPISTVNSSFVPVRNFPQGMGDPSPLRRNTGLERRNTTKEGGEEGVDHRGAASIPSEPRIIKDSVAIPSTATARGLCFAFNDGGDDDDVMSGDSNLSTMSVGRWLKDV